MMLLVRPLQIHLPGMRNQKNCKVAGTAGVVCPEGIEPPTLSLEG